MGKTPLLPAVILLPMLRTKSVLSCVYHHPLATNYYRILYNLGNGNSYVVIVTCLYNNSNSLYINTAVHIVNLRSPYRPNINA